VYYKYLPIFVLDKNQKHEKIHSFNPNIIYRS